MASAFAVIDHEERLQIGDKTRLAVDKSFISPASATALTTATVTPGFDESAQNVFSSTVEDRYLDWIFTDWNFDIITGFNDVIDFTLGGVDYAAELEEGTYPDMDDLCDEIASALNGVGAPGTFTVTHDVKNKITIAHSTSTFDLLPYGTNGFQGLLKHIGFADKDAGKYSGNSIAGRIVEYGIKQIAAAVGNGSESSTVYEYVHLFNVDGDALFSTDQDLITWEPDIMRWVQAGRSSFLNIHREAQDQILYWLDKEGYVNVYRVKYDKFDLVDVSEVNEWSAFTALSIIMLGISNKTDDVFLKKHYEYKKKAQEARERAVLRIDIDEDGQVDVGEEVDVRAGQVVTR